MDTYNQNLLFRKLLRVGGFFAEFVQFHLEQNNLTDGSFCQENNISPEQYRKMFAHPFNMEYIKHIEGTNYAIDAVSEYSGVSRTLVNSIATAYIYEYRSNVTNGNTIVSEKDGMSNTQRAARPKE